MAYVLQNLVTPGHKASGPGFEPVHICLRVELITAVTHGLSEEGGETEKADGGARKAPHMRRGVGCTLLFLCAENWLRAGAQEPDFPGSSSDSTYH